MPDDNSDKSSSLIEQDDQTIVENIKENESIISTTGGEALEIVNKILDDIDKDLGTQLFGEDQDENAELVEDEVGPRKKSISFSLPAADDERAEYSSEENIGDDEAIIEEDDAPSITSEATVTDNIPNIINHETHPDVAEAQRKKIEEKAKKILDSIGHVCKQKYFDDKDGRQSSEKSKSGIEKQNQQKISKFEQDCLFTYPDLSNNICR